MLENQNILNPQEIGRMRGIEALETFVHNPAMGEIADYFGLEIDKSQDVLPQYAASFDSWDVRRNGDKERYNVNWKDPTDEVSKRASDKVFELTNKLGMVESSHPTKDHYDFVTILGGANKAPYDRLKFALEQGVTFDHLILLGAGRRIGDDPDPEKSEREISKDYAPGAKTEYDLMNGAVESLLGDRIVHRETIDVVVPGGRADHDPENWKVRYYELDDGTPIFSLSSDFVPEQNAEKPISKHKMRANSGDTYVFMRALAGDALNENTDVLLLSNAFYTPAQHMDGVRELSLTTGAQVETIGYDAAYGGKERTAMQLKQELKSGVDAAIRLEKALATTA